MEHHTGTLLWDGTSSEDVVDMYGGKLVVPDAFKGPWPRINMYNSAIVDLHNAAPLVSNPGIRVFGRRMPIVPRGNGYWL